MYKSRYLLTFLACVLLLTQAGCWSSKEIEDLSLYTAIALDTGKLSSAEQSLEEKGGGYYKQNTITVTVEIAPKKSNGSSGKSNKSSSDSPKYVNMSETGDSVLEILRQFATRLDRPLIGHHLKVFIISKELLQQQKIEDLMDFMLRDNDIRPSTLIYLSEGRAADTLVSKFADDIPAFHLKQMVGNRFRTSKIMKGVIISELDALMYAKQSFVLQNIAEADRDLEFSGGGIIKGDTGKWIGSLNQQDVESIAWIKGEVEGGTIKAYNQDHKPITYEIKSADSKVSVKLNKEQQPAFHVSIESEGRLIEKWGKGKVSTNKDYLENVQRIFEERLNSMIQSLMQKMQSEYKVEVAGFGNRLSIEKPQVWKKLKDHWDEAFCRIPVTFDVKMKITDYGSFME
ncbi:Ger(x)C family spore germination protein [Paenibacillus sp. sgz5001063]|uniref:Ger(x)C family spore germination protein n=1 Tax=Paenibacillus sp. sgz5001063 TaxID=3242474 RepID=UPI0036D336B3